jgi:hypothetical protein
MFYLSFFYLFLELLLCGDPCLEFDSEFLAEINLKDCLSISKLLLNFLELSTC